MNIGIILLFITALILYLSFISRSFDEGDAFNFALALSRFDVAAHQPHPPGYPVFVFIASIPYLFTRNPLFSLVLVSALSGALTLIPTYAIARRLFNREIAFFSALALMVAPGFWLLSEQALSSDLFVLLLTLALSQLLAGRESRSYRYASWGTLGIALGVRPFNFVLVAPFLLETVKAGRRDLVWCLLLFLGTFSLGLVPAVLLTGYPQYLAAVLDQLTHHVRYDVNPFGLSAVDRLVVLLLELMNGVGANLPFRICRFDPFVSTSRYASINFVLLLLLCGAGVILLLVRRVRDFSNVPFLLSWILPYSAFVYLLGAPGYTRYMLPVIPAVLMMLVASGFHAVRFLRSSRLNWSIVRPLRSLARYGVILLFIVSTFAYSLPLAAVIHTEPPPNVQLAVYVSRNYDPSTTTIIVLHEFRAFQFYGRGFRYVHCCYDAQKALGIIQSYSKSSDSILITSSALDSLQKMGVMLHVIRVAEFSRSPLVKVEDSMVTLYRIQ
jgi:4-amino-4-deoxy-L-arabinose transferase-like glycosyltransferase